MATLTRREMEAVIRGGGSVLYNGRLISKLSDLPTAAELARGNPRAEQAAAAELQAQVADLQAQLAALQGAPPVETTPPAFTPAPQGEPVPDDDDLPAVTTPAPKRK